MRIAILSSSLVLASVVWGCKSSRSQLKTEPTLTVESRSASNFVRAESGQLKLGGQPFRFFGSNFYRLALADAFGGKIVKENKAGKTTYPQIDRVMQNYAAEGIAVIRLWGFSCQGSRGTNVTPALINQDLSLNAAAWEQLDYTIAAASRSGIKIIFPFVNFEHEYCGMEWWVENTLGKAPEGEQAGLSYSCVDQKKHRLNQLVDKPEQCAGKGDAVMTKELFYTNDIVKAKFKKYVQQVLERRNTFTGIALKDDPTILALELANEPHTSDHYECMLSDKIRNNYDTCMNIDKANYQIFQPGEIVYNWLKEFSTFVKTIDSKHLISSGEEGYRTNHQDASCFEIHEWIHNGHKGVDFARNATIPTIDIMSTHLYPDNWAFPKEKLDFFDRCIVQDRARIAKEQNKVIILEETGFSELGYEGKPDDYRKERAYYLSKMFAYANRAGFQGTMVWQASPLTLNDQVAEDDSFTFPIIIKQNNQTIVTAEGMAVQKQIECSKNLQSGADESTCTYICPAAVLTDSSGLGTWPDGTSCQNSPASGFLRKKISSNSPIQEVPITASKTSKSNADEYPNCNPGTVGKDGWAWITDPNICGTQFKSRRQFADMGGCSCTIP